MIADKFHVIQRLIKSIEARRKTSQFRKSHGSGRRQQKLLSHRPAALTDEERQELHEWLEKDARLKQLHAALQELREVYDQSKEQEGKRKLEHWLKKYSVSSTPALQSFANLIEQWKDGILAYFRYRATNGPMEGTNNKIKLLKRRGYGYRNAAHLFLRIRLECKPA